MLQHWSLYCLLEASKRRSKSARVYTGLCSDKTRTEDTSYGDRTDTGSIWETVLSLVWKRPRRNFSYVTRGHGVPRNCVALCSAVSERSFFYSPMERKVFDGNSFEWSLRALCLLLHVAKQKQRCCPLKNNGSLFSYIFFFLHLATCGDPFFATMRAASSPRFLQRSCPKTTPPDCIRKPNDRSTKAAAELF